MQSQPRAPGQKAAEAQAADLNHRPGFADGGHRTEVLVVETLGTQLAPLGRVIAGDILLNDPGDIPAHLQGTLRDARHLLVRLPVDEKRGIANDKDVRLARD